MADTKISAMTAAGASQRNHGTIFAAVNNGTNYKDTFDGYASYLNTGFYTTVNTTVSTVGSLGETYGKLKVNSGNVLYTGRALIRGDEATGVFRKLYLGNFNTNRATGTDSQILGGAFNTGLLGDNQFILGGHHNKVVGDSSFVLAGSFNNVSGGAVLNIDGFLCSLNNFVIGGVGNSASGAYTFVGNGQGNVAIGGLCTVVNGLENQNRCDYGIIGAGHQNYLGLGLSSFILGGDSNVCSGLWNGVVGGVANKFLGTTVASTSFIGAGTLNTINSNSTSSSNSAIVAGSTNVITDSANTVVLAGTENSISLSQYSLIGGGYANAIRNNSQYCAIVAGLQNFIVQAPNGLGRDFIGAGGNNYISGHYDSIVGGFSNIISGSYTCIVGGSQNLAKGNYQFIGGGQTNLVTGEYGMVGGGVSNVAGLVSSDWYATVAGGGSNRSYGLGAAILGGTNNLATGSYTVVVGGSLNKAQGDYTFVGAGFANTGFSSGAVVAGGKLNLAYGSMSNVLGGESNISSGAYSTVVGGYLNLAQSGNSTVVGGVRNVVRATGSVIVGGNRNIIYNAGQSLIGNGTLNLINGTGVNVVLNGNNNTISSGGYNTILNGFNVNLNAGNFNLAVGKDITINADSNFAWGRNITSNVNGTMVLGDSSTSIKNAFIQNSAYLYFSSGVNIMGPLVTTIGSVPASQFSPSGRLGEVRVTNSAIYTYTALGWMSTNTYGLGSGNSTRAVHPITFFDYQSNLSYSPAPGYTEVNGVGTQPKYCLDLNNGLTYFNPVSMRLTTYVGALGGPPAFNIQIMYSSNPDIPVSSWTGLGPVISLNDAATTGNISVTGLTTLPAGLSQVYLTPVFYNADIIDTSCAINGLALTLYGTSS